MVSGKNLEFVSCAPCTRYSQLFVTLMHFAHFDIACSTLEIRTNFGEKFVKNKYGKKERKETKERKKKEYQD